MSTLKYEGDSGVQYFTYEVDGMPAGEAQLHGTGYIWAFEIYEAYRSQHHGTAFLNQLLEHASWIHSVVHLLVRPSNMPALHLYRAAGFKDLRVSERGLLMRKFLTPSA
jgi:ribosomal protein S18 acetylase RimI-like enzyme